MVLARPLQYGCLPALSGPIAAVLELRVIPHAVSGRSSCPGMVPEMANPYSNLSVWNNLMLMAELYRIPLKEALERANYWLRDLGLLERWSDEGLLQRYKATPHSSHGAHQ